VQASFETGPVGGGVGIRRLTERDSCDRPRGAHSLSFANLRPRLPKELGT